MFCPTVPKNVDLNARPCLNEYDEAGRLVMTVPGLFGDGVQDPAMIFNGVNGSTRTGVAMGQPAYSNVLQSFEVQPYTY